MLYQMFDVRIHAGDEIIQSEDIPSFRQQPFAKMRTQKPRPAGDHCPHAPSSEKSIRQCSVTAREHPNVGTREKLRRRDAGATKSQEGGVHSAWARGTPGLFPELLPLPDIRLGGAAANLLGQQQNLPALMRAWREHSCKHVQSVW